MKKSLFWDRINSKVQCQLCPNFCKISEGGVGSCRIRKNVGGELYTLTYSRFTSVALDPIEKKPLYHFFPKTKIMSFGTIGCNFACKFCQNWEISQVEFDISQTEEISPKNAVEISKRNNSIGIAYTYNEPLINIEWLYETMELAKKENLKNVLVTNGYINEEPLKKILEFVDAANVDIKSFNEDFYRKLCNGKLAPVLKFVEILFKEKKHIEITNLIIPNHNDKEDEIEKLVDYIHSLSPEIPLHFSRYFPHYKMNEPPTPVSTLVTARNIAMKKLKYVYIGNVLNTEYNSTFCSNCGCILIKRDGYDVELLNLEGRKCKKCGTEAAVIC